MWVAAILGTVLPFVAFGSASSTPSLDLRVVASTPKTVTLAWDAYPGAVGYVFAVDGKRRSWTLNPLRTRAVFGLSRTLAVQPVMALPARVWQPGAPASAALGAAGDTADVGLQVVGQTAKTVTLSWKPVPDVIGYAFHRAGARVSWTLDPVRSAATFWKDGGDVSVLPLVLGEPAVWTADSTAATTTTDPTAGAGGTSTGGATPAVGGAGAGATTTTGTPKPVPAAAGTTTTTAAPKPPTTTTTASPPPATTTTVAPPPPPPVTTTTVAPPPPPPTTTTVAPPPAPAPSTPSGWDGVLSATSLPGFSPTRTVTVTTPTELRIAIDNLRAGDLVKPSGPMTVTGATLWIDASLASLAVIDLRGVTIRAGTAGSLEHAVAIVGAQNLRLLGGDVSTPGNVCLWLQDNSSVAWHDVDLHDCPGTGLMAQGTSRAQTGLDIRARIWNAGTDPGRLDPHAIKGTGLHAAYIGGASSPTSGRFILDVRDQATGAAVQAGANLTNSDLYIRATRITKVVSGHVAGNALQLWGGGLRSIRVRWIGGSELAGRVVETDGITAGSSGIVVDYGRSGGTRLSPAFATNAAVTYRDIG